ncbi:MAG: Fic family protein [Treponema sp.]|nr:Fic family protein [Treponema sp.]
MRLTGGIYHRTQIDLTYNSNHIEGSRLTHEQTRYIFETRTIGFKDQDAVPVDDILETANHFVAFDYLLRTVGEPLTEDIIKELHRILKTGTADAQKPYFNVGDYKQLANEVGGRETCLPADVAREMRALCGWYDAVPDVTLHTLAEHHWRFERIHPFQDGNGRVGRLIMLKECLRHSIVPFIITEELKLFYYRGIKSWDEERGYLRDTCLSAQDEMKSALDYFGIAYE